MFHIVYAVFISFLFKLDMTGILSVLSFAALFLINNIISFKKELENNPEQRYAIKDLFAGPYARIFPMHLTIIFGTMIITYTKNNVFVLIFFMMLKTFVDVKMYLDEKNKATKH